MRSSRPDGTAAAPIAKASRPASTHVSPEGPGRCASRASAFSAPLCTRRGLASRVMGSATARSGLDDQLREARLAQVRLLDGAHELGDLLDVGLERVVADDADVQEVAEADVRPVEVVLDRVLPGELDELPAHARPRV